MDKETTNVARSNRFQADLPATIELGGRGIECRAHNLSRSGARVRGTLPSTDVLETRVTLRSPAGDLRLTIGCRVVRSEVVPGSDERELALEFLEVRPDDQPTLEGLVARAMEGISPAALAGIPSDASEQEIRAALEAIPLPHRIQLAARSMPREREIMIHDPNMQVIDALARNPSLLPHEVLSILRMRNIMPNTVAHIAKDPRWSGNELLRVQAVSHRSLPLALAGQLLQEMPVPMLRRVIQVPGLNPALREGILSRIPGGGRR